MNAVHCDPAAPGTSGQAAKRRAFEANKLSKRLHRQVGQAIGDFNMIEAGDKVMVCVSGGKDSYALLDILLALRERAPVAFDIVAVNLDQKQPGFPEHVLPNYLRSRGVAFHIEKQDTYASSSASSPRARRCAACARGCAAASCTAWRASSARPRSRSATIATTCCRRFFMNMFFGSRMKGMPPKLVSDDGAHVVIRPLAYVAESDLERWAAHRQFPIIPCTLCGSQDNLQRVQIRQMLREWEHKFPGRIDNMFSAMGNIVPSHLMDRNLYPFATLKATGVADARGDKAFDDDEDCAPRPPAPSSSCGPVARRR